jgi:UMF1 family MFS transporter
MDRAAHLLTRSASGRPHGFLMQRLFERLGLPRRELRAWAMYDWANSAFQSTIITAVFPPFFASVAAADLPPAVATARFAWATTIAVTITALIGPVLGAVADARARKKRLLAICMLTGVIATALMSLIERNQWQFAAALFVVANIAIAASFVFYDSLLPHIAAPEEMDRASTAGYAIGYLGGGVLLVANLAWILAPATFGLANALSGIRLSFLSVAAWWLIFTLPLLRRVPEPPATAAPATLNLAATFRMVWQTFNELRAHRQAFTMLVAFLLYNDGIQTIIRMAAIYGTEIGIDRNAQIAAFVVVQFVGVPFSFLFGAMADRVGAKPSIFVALAIYTGISVLGYFMTAAWQFFALAFLVGMVQGGSQALSRSLFARMIPRHKSSEYFGFFSVFEKFAGIVGPGLFAASVTVFGSSRAAVLSVIAFFVAGAIVLSRVDVAAGEAAAVAAPEAPCT